MSELPSKGLARTETGRSLHANSEGDVNQALRTLALNGGNVAATLKQLKGAGLKIPRSRLNNWAQTQFPARYYEIRREVAAQVSEAVAGDALENALTAGSVQRAALERLGANVDELEPKDLAATVRALAQSKDSDVKVAQLLRDRPTEIKETRSVHELMDVINSVPNLIKNEIPVDAQVVEDDDE